MKPSKILLQSMIDALENRQTYTSVTKLFQDIAKTNFAKKAGMSAEECLELAVEYNCKSKTGKIEMTTFTTVDQKRRRGRGKSKLIIDKVEFQKQVDTLEANQTFDTLGEFWQALEETDWAKNHSPRPLTAAVAIARAKEFGITHKTTSSGRGRAKLEVNKEELEKVIRELESERTFAKLGDLWDAVSETDWAKGHAKPLAPATIYQRVQEYEIECKTKSARRRRKKQKLDIDSDSGETKSKESNQVALPPVVVDDAISRFNAGIERRANLDFVVVPSGPCPHKLSGTDKDSVLGWCGKVIDSMEDKGVQIAPSGLTYFARQFYDYHSNEYKIVKECIEENKFDLYQ